MGDHFWPSVYPGIIVGLLVALPGRTVLKAVAGACAGFAGATAALIFADWAGIADDVVQLALLLGAAAGAAVAVVALADRMARRPASN